MPQNHKYDMRYLFIAFSYLVIFLVLVIALASRAKADAKTPLEVVKNGVNQAKSIIDNPSVKFEEKRKQLHDLLLPFFDLDKMTRMIMGSNFKKYEKRSVELTPLLVELIENSYMKLSTLDSAKDSKIIYGNETIDGQYAIVDTKIIAKNDKQIPVSYRLALKNGEWKVYDMVIEGVSMVSNYRSQVNAILNRGSSGRDPFDVLLDKIRTNIAEAKSRQ